MGSIVSRYFSQNSWVLAMEPESFYKAVKSGMGWVQLTGVEAVFSLALETNGIKPEHAVINVVPFDDRPEISLILRRETGAMIEAFNWVLIDGYEEDLFDATEYISMLSHSLGIKDVQWSDSKIHADDTLIH
jgi:hypothetical protein